MFSRGSTSASSSPGRDTKTQDNVEQPKDPAVAEPVTAETTERIVAQAASAPRVSTIGPDLRIVGDLVCKGELHIEGRVEGDIVSKIISVKQGAQIDGSLSAETIVVGGAVIGQIKAPTVTVSGSARVLGDVLHRTLAVEAGAHLEGHCRQLDAAEAMKGGQLKAAGSQKRG